MKFILEKGKELKKASSLTYSMFHFRDVVFPKMNDMIYRRRLLLSNSNNLLLTLKAIEQRLRGSFNHLYDFQNAALRRDMLLLFLSQQELESRLAFEHKVLPKHQDPTLFETYSIILQLKKVQAKNPPAKNDADILIQSTPEIILDRLREQYEILESHKLKTPNMDWMSYRVSQVEGDNSTLVGLPFLAETEDDAASFIEDLNTCDLDDKYRSVRAAMRALSFMPKDPMLFSDEHKKQEDQCLDMLFVSMTSQDTKGISLLERVELEEIRMSNLERSEMTPDLMEEMEQSQDN